MNNIINISSPNKYSINYGKIIPITYDIQNIDLNFKSVVFELNGEITHTDSRPIKKNIFNIEPISGLNFIKAYCKNIDDKLIFNTEVEFTFTSIIDNIDKKTQIYDLIEFQLPEFIKSDYPKFVEFVSAYYEFLETSNDPSMIPYNLENYKNIDEIPIFVLEKIKNEVMKDFRIDLTKDLETNTELNERHIVKNIKEFYDSKGTENSIKFLFRILFDTEISIYYPRNDLFKPSASIYSIQNILKINIPNSVYQQCSGDDFCIRDINNSIVFQKDANEKYKLHARISKTVVNEINGNTIAELYLDDINGVYNSSLDTYITTIVNGYQKISKIESTNYTTVKTSLTNTSYVSDSKVIQDSYYYQDFSYDILSKINPTKYISNIKKLVHPAGFKLFGTLLLESEFKPLINNIINTSTTAPIQAETKLLSNPRIGNYLPYVVNTTIDLKFVPKLQSGTVTYVQAYPNGYYYGNDGLDTKQLTVSASQKNRSNSVKSIMRNNTSGSVSDIETEVQEFVPDAMTLEQYPPTNKYCSIIPVNENDSQYLYPESISKANSFWVVGKHFNRVFETSESTNTLKSFLDFKINEVINIEYTNDTNI